MKITYNEEFKAIAENPNSLFSITKSKFYITSGDSVDKDHLISAPVETLYDDKTGTLLLYLDLSLVDWTIYSGLSFSSFNNIIILYNNLLLDSEDIAFVINNEGQKLLNGVNLIRIKGLNWGPGFQETDNNLEITNEDLCLSLYIDTSTTKYVSKSSFNDYINELNRSDDYDHLFTTYINSFGLRIY